MRIFYANLNYSVTFFSVMLNRIVRLMTEKFFQMVVLHVENKICKVKYTNSWTVNERNQIIERNNKF